MQSLPEVLRLSPEDALSFLVNNIEALPADERIVVGIAGGPGVGKSTIAGQLVAALNARRPHSAAYVPMDGFHMRHAKLEALGTAKDKGAPHTFEGEAFADFLRGLKVATGPVHGPGYSRAIEDVVEDQFTVAPEARVLVTEGNYLLLANSPWWHVRPLLDYAAYLDVPREKVRARLLKRHAEHGLFSEQRNREHVERVDLANYDLVGHSRGRADVVIELVTEK